MGEADATCVVRYRKGIVIRNFNYEALEPAFDTCYLALLLMAFASAPIKALYLTNYSSFWHDYEEQIGLLREGLSRYANVEITLVGKRESDVLETLKRDGFSGLRCYHLQPVPRG